MKQEKAPYLRRHSQGNSHSPWALAPSWFIMVPAVANMLRIHLALTLIGSRMSQASGYTYSVQLHPRLTFNWQPDYERHLIIANLVYTFPPAAQPDQVKDWIAVGFSANGSFSGTDECVLWVDWKGQTFLHDMHTEANDSVLIMDRHQDCLDLQMDDVLPGESHVSWSFVRPFSTCHDDLPDEDYNIQEGTTHLIWSFGKGPLYSASGVNIADPEMVTEFGFTRLSLLKADVHDAFPRGVRVLEIRHQIQVPSDDTTYWCSVHKLPEDFRRKHHVIQYEPAIADGNEGLIHHMEVFHCIAGADSSQTFPIWQGPCGDDQAPAQLTRCKKVLAAWAIGAGPFVYPEDAGLSLGGHEFGSYVMLEVHVNNQMRKSGLKDDSGIRFYVTQDLRPHDAGIMELGLIYNDHMAIPPGMKSFTLEGYCLPACTAVGLPSNGITIFGSQLHTHATGFKVATQHFRAGLRLPDINYDPHYSTHFQEIRVLRNPRLVLPGDELVTTCWFNTEGKPNATLGGFRFNDEMCVNYIHYFPKTPDLEICKSAIDPTALKNYFLDLNLWEEQDTDPVRKSVANNYHSIQWNRLRSERLHQLYQTAPVEMQCTSGSGSALPGKWTGMANLPLLRRDEEPGAGEACSDLSWKREILKRKRSGRPFNEMRRKRIDLRGSISAAKREPDTYSDDDSELEGDQWEEYDTWGLDRRRKKGRLGSMRRKRGPVRPMN